MDIPMDISVDISMDIHVKYVDMGKDVKFHMSGSPGVHM